MARALPRLGVPTGAAYFDAALEGHTLVNEEILRRKSLPPIYTSGAGYGVERYRDTWKFADEVVSSGTGDCEALSTWRAAELRITGEDPGAQARTYRSGRNKFHAVVERSDDGRGARWIEDPSAIMGMKIRDPGSYVGKIVDNFGPLSVDGDDDAPTAEEAAEFGQQPADYSDEQGSAIDDFFHMGPSQPDLGPGVGPAESHADDDHDNAGRSSSELTDDDLSQFFGQPPSGDQGGGGGGGSDGGGSSSGGRDRGADDYAAAARAQQGGQQPQQGRPGQQPKGSKASGSAKAAHGSSHAAPRGPTKKPTPKKRPPSKSHKKGGHGVHGLIDVPVVWMEGGDDLADEEYGPDDGAQLPPQNEEDTRDVSVDVQPVDDDGDGKTDGYVSTVRVPLKDGKTIAVQSTKASTAKKAAGKALNIAKIIGSNPDVQNFLLPQASTTMKIIKSDTAKKIFHSLF